MYSCGFGCGDVKERRQADRVSFRRLANGGTGFVSESRSDREKAVGALFSVPTTEKETTNNHRTGLED